METISAEVVFLLRENMTSIPYKRITSQKMLSLKNRLTEEEWA